MIRETTRENSTESDFEHENLNQMTFMQSQQRPDTSNLRTSSDMQRRMYYQDESSSGSKSQRQ